jgi:hypothetical protein
MVGYDEANRSPVLLVSKHPTDVPSELCAFCHLHVEVEATVSRAFNFFKYSYDR